MMNANITSSHKDIVQRIFAEVWTQADFSNVNELLASRMTYHIRGRSVELTPEDLIEIVTRWKQAFPDIRFEVEDIVTEGDKAAARILYTGTQLGKWKDIPPTGRSVEVREMMFFRFDNGQIVEVWEVTDEFSQRSQLLKENE